MKIGRVLSRLLWIILALSVSAAATTLKLSSDIDVLVIDGKEITSALLKGAYSLELDGGQHQLLFKVVKPVCDDEHTYVAYSSLPMIVAFNSKEVGAISITLPRIETLRDAHSFDTAMNYQIIDKKGRPLPIKTDVLSFNILSESTELEKIISDYNSQNNQASVPEFAVLHVSSSPLVKLKHLYSCEIKSQASAPENDQLNETVRCWPFGTATLQRNSVCRLNTLFRRVTPVVPRLFIHDFP